MVAITFTEDALSKIVRDYTREAGVRELERRMSGVARKLARGVAECHGRTTGAGEGDLFESGEPTLLSEERVRELLGPPPYTPEPREEGNARAGIANGLAWTAAGGEILDVEVAVTDADGRAAFAVDAPEAGDSAAKSNFVSSMA